jgi:hypothetical protein
MNSCTCCIGVRERVSASCHAHVNCTLHLMVSHTQPDMRLDATIMLFLLEDIASSQQSLRYFHHAAPPEVTLFVAVTALSAVIVSAIPNGSAVGSEHMFLAQHVACLLWCFHAFVVLQSKRFLSHRIWRFSNQSLSQAGLRSSHSAATLRAPLVLLEGGLGRPS